MVPVIPATGNLSMGAFEQTVIAHLERLEAGQNSITAAILDIQQSQTCRHTYGRRFRSAFVKGTCRLRSILDGWLKNHGHRVEAYRTMVEAKILRFAVWMMEVGVATNHESPANRKMLQAHIEEGRRDASFWEKTARGIISPPMSINF
jgi:hypothetical protein